mmetsp:Transcript_12989/g.20133  ORF Transcript_12989/g.20133 Transcript_12989/m.20133 type:complete len:266 (+) Transcript_12989:737-1534(+)
MDVVHPMHAVVSSEVDDFRVDQAACRRNSSARLVAAHCWLHPSQSLGVEVEDVVKLSKLVGLSAEDIDFLVEGDGRVLEAAYGSNSLRGDGPAPLKLVEVKDQKVVQPIFSVAASKDVHLVVNNTGGVELAHRCLPPDDVGDIEAQLVHPLLEVDEDHIGKHLEAVPAAIDDDLAAVPDLTGVAHSGLRQLVLVHLRLHPGLLLGIEDEDVVDDSFLAIAFSSAKNDQILPELGGAVAVPGGRRLAGSWLARIDLHHVPRVLLKI